MTNTRQPLREGAVLMRNGVDVGELTSGNFSPILERGVGLGFVAGGAVVGEALIAVQRGREIPVTVCELPFVRKAG
jgi:aminomethyltransferase